MNEVDRAIELEKAILEAKLRAQYLDAIDRQRMEEEGIRYSDFLRRVQASPPRDVNYEEQSPPFTLEEIETAQAEIDASGYGHNR